MKIVLLDLDGTLVRTGRAGPRAVDWVMSERFGVEGSCEGLGMAGRTDPAIFRRVLRKGLGRPLSRADLKKFETAYLKRLPAEVKKSVQAGTYELIPGARRLLKVLSRKRDILVGLGTGNLEKGARIKLGPSGLLRYLPFGGFGSDCAARPGLLRAAVRRARCLLDGEPLSRSGVFIIGDTPLDIRAARRAGYRAGAVYGGFGNRKELQSLRPEVLEEDFSDLRPWLSWIGGENG